MSAFGEWWGRYGDLAGQCVRESEAEAIWNAAIKHAEALKPSHNPLKADNWRCGTKDCVCNVSGVCDCHNYTQPPTTAV